MRQHGWTETVEWENTSFFSLCSRKVDHFRNGGHIVSNVFTQAVHPAGQGVLVWGPTGLMSSSSHSHGARHLAWTPLSRVLCPSGWFLTRNWDVCSLLVVEMRNFSKIVSTPFLQKQVKTCKGTQAFTEHEAFVMNEAKGQSSHREQREWQRDWQVGGRGAVPSGHYPGFGEQSQPNWAFQILPPWVFVKKLQTDQRRAIKDYRPETKAKGGLALVLHSQGIGTITWK